MNHVLENSLILAALLIIILIPILWTVKRSRKLKKEKINNELAMAEDSLQASFQHIDHLDSFVLAMDRDKKLIVQMDLMEYKNQLIDLTDVGSCTLEEKKQGNVTQLLQLVLRNKSRQILHHIIFYKQYIDNDWHLKRSTKTAAQWNFLINNIIRLSA